MITDTHAHLFWKTFDDDRQAVVTRARERGVQRMIIVGTDVPTSEAAFELCRDDDELFPTAGIHPHDASDSDASARARIRELCLRDECVAVGETGLDLFKEYSPREAQLDNFHWHLELAKELRKPVVVHCRDAHEETLECLTTHRGEQLRGVMHCYSMGPAELPLYVELGFYISFSGVVSYPRNDEIREAARTCPADRLLVETDCPFLAPQGNRGKRNEPAFVRDVLECVAQVRGEPLEALARTTTANAARLFGLDG